MKSNPVCPNCNLADKTMTAEMVACLYESSTNSKTETTSGSISNSAITVSRSYARATGSTTTKILEKVPKKPDLPLRLEAYILFSFAIPCFVVFTIFQYLQVQMEWFVWLYIVVVGAVMSYFSFPFSKRLYEHDLEKYWIKKDYFDRFWICLRDGQTWLEE